MSNQLYVVAGGSQQPNLIPCEGAHTPKFASLLSRKQSFEDGSHRLKWNKELKKMVNDLSDAGFYFTHREHDLVICFYCGGGMRGWKPFDIPLIEHAAAFPECTYIKMLMTPLFINESIKLKRGATSREEPEPDYSPVLLGELKLKEAKKKEKINENHILCQVCCVGQREVVFLPCSHFLSCIGCAPSFVKCILCRKEISAFLKISYNLEV